MDDTTISDLYYSRDKIPQGFPSNVGSWILENTYSANTDNTTTSWTEFSTSNRLIVPLGAWVIGYKGSWGVREASGTSSYGGITLSTSSSSLWTDRLTSFSWASGSSSDIRQYIDTDKSTDAVFSSETTLYMLGQNDGGSQTFVLGSTGADMFIYAINGYL